MFDEIPTPSHQLERRERMLNQVFRLFQCVHPKLRREWVMHQFERVEAARLCRQELLKR